MKILKTKNKKEDSFLALIIGILAGFIFLISLYLKYDQDFDNAIIMLFSIIIFGIASTIALIRNGTKG